MGHHHITMGVGDPQEDFDFHTKVLGLKCVKRTLFYDGATPNYHFYHGNDMGEESTLVTTFPVRHIGIKATKGSGQIDRFALSVPTAAISYWKDRLQEHGFDVTETERFSETHLDFVSPHDIHITLAGIIAAAMSTLSSTVNSLASLSLMDIYRRFAGTTVDETRSLATSRLLTLFWGAVLISFASLFEDSNNAVVELGLTIASYTYGGLLGVFLLGIIIKRSDQSDALVAFAVTIVSMVLIVFGIWRSTSAGWLFIFDPTDAEIIQHDLVSIAWPWYPVIGSAITVCVGALTSALRNR